MKRIIYLIALSLGFSLSTIGQAKKNVEDISVHEIAQKFMHAQLNNDAALLRKMLDKDVVIFTPGKLGEVQIAKADYINFTQQGGKLDQNCYPHYEVLSSNTSTAEVNIDFTYPDFIVKHFIKMAKKRNEWKIVELRKTFESDPAPVTVMQQ